MTSAHSGPHEPTPFDDGALYDLLFERFELGRDFYMGLARAAQGPILDLACGTGRIMLPCLQAGLDIEGVDLFPSMLARLQQKASALGLKPQVHQANMTNFRLPRRYALIFIANNAFLHNLTTEEQLATLQTCRDHLLPRGLLAFDTAFPGPAWVAAPDGTRELELEIPHPETGLPVRMWDTRTFDRVQQLQHSRCWMQTGGLPPFTPPERPFVGFTRPRWNCSCALQISRAGGFLATTMAARCCTRPMR